MGQTGEFAASSLIVRQVASPFDRHTRCVAPLTPFSGVPTSIVQVTQ
jgi:hypothetical protein